MLSVEAAVSAAKFGAAILENARFRRRLRATRSFYIDRRNFPKTKARWNTPAGAYLWKSRPLLAAVPLAPRKPAYRPGGPEPTGALFTTNGHNHLTRMEFRRRERKRVELRVQWL